MQELTMEQNNISWFPDIVAILCILVSAFTIFTVVIVRLSKSSYRIARKLSINNKTGDEHFYQRPLGKMETVFHHLHKDGTLQVSMAALAKTSKCLRENDIQKVIRHLREKHPLLRMRLIEKEGHPYFATAIKPTPFTIVTSEDWLNTFQTSLVEKLDETEYLWKIKMIENRKELMDRNASKDIAFIFTFHHAIGDGLCKARLLTEFFKCLNRVLKNESLKEKRYSLLPSVDYFMQPLLKRSSTEKGFFNKMEKEPSNLFLQKVAQKKYLCSTENKRNKFIETIGAVCLKNPYIEPKTVVIPMTFTDGETGSILRACKARDATVQGMLTAAAGITMGHLHDSSPKKTAETNIVQIRTTVNLRRYLNSKVPEDYMGSYFVGLFEQDIVIPKVDGLEKQFWQCAADSTTTLRGQLKETTFITTFWNMLETVYHSLKTPKPKSTQTFKQREPNRTNELLSLNNYGLCPSKTLETDFVKLHSCFCAVAEHKKGPIFTINAVTVEGQLCLSIVYYTNITTRETAVKFANDLKNKILHYSKNS